MNQQVLQVQIPLAGPTYPVNLMCLSTGQVALVAVRPIPGCLYEMEGSIKAYIYQDQVELWREEIIERKTFYFNTLYNYKEHPLLLGWLQQFNLHNPFNNKGA